MADFKFLILSLGDELLDGTVTDTNSRWLAERLQPLGVRPTEQWVLPDSIPRIVQAVRDSLGRFDVVLTCGGLGPTTDDLTIEAVSLALNRPLVRDQKAVDNIRKRLRALGRVGMFRANQKQAWVPSGAHVLSNPNGTAVGLRMKERDTTFFCFPGVPREFFHLCDRELIPWLKKHKAKDTHRRILKIYRLFPIPEAELNRRVGRMSIPSDVGIGYRTTFPENHLKLLIPAKRIRTLDLKIKKEFGELIFGVDGEELPAVTVEALRRRRWTLATVESCTGGRLSSALTGVSGASAVFYGGWVTYSNEAKIAELQVSERSIARHGAVSRAVAREMAERGRVKSGADLAIAITGIAGPTGGTPQKPVGTVWMALSSKRGRTIVKRFLWPGSRERIQTISVATALNWIRLVCTRK